LVPLDAVGATQSAICHVSTLVQRHCDAADVAREQRLVAMVETVNFSAMLSPLLSVSVPPWPFDEVACIAGVSR